MIASLLRARRDRRCACAPDPRPAACAPRRRLRDAIRAPADSRRARAARGTASRRRQGPARARSRVDGRGASSSFSISPQMRSAGRSSSAMRSAHLRASSSSRSNSNRAANWIARSTRRLSSPNVAGSTTRSWRRARSARPSNGSRYSLGQRIPGDRVDGEVAPPAASSTPIDGSPLMIEAPVAASRLRFAARQRHVDVADFVHLKAFADRLDAAERLEQLPQSLGGDRRPRCRRPSIRGPSGGRAPSRRR